MHRTTRMIGAIRPFLDRPAVSQGIEGPQWPEYLSDSSVGGAIEEGEMEEARENEDYMRRRRPMTSSLTMTTLKRSLRLRTRPLRASSSETLTTNPCSLIIGRSSRKRAKGITGPSEGPGDDSN
ncbi:hypothetical protein J1N35_012098 [Gossypium stocksii]|uniref:Uncharacterized protein n=1 Tax=Gossypium stocksii TaxID=47602 RepID=A0A9D4ADZ1_9ROSI|nr:hypothetical protein J1N35_012098 [Gossypium stocksii]